MTRPPSPSLQALAKRARALFAARSELRERFGQVDSIGYWYWLMTDGLREDALLRSLFPVPAAALLQRVVGAGATTEFYFESGLNNASEFFLALTSAGFDFGRAEAVLDFGCGCGRLFRFFARFADSCEFVGVDVDAEAVKWCAQNIDYGEFHVLSSYPPMPLEAGSFDAVYAYSVFSHLPEALHRAWLEELVRVTKPGGLVAVTTQGRRVLEKALHGDIAALPCSIDQLRQDLRELTRAGFLYYPYDFETPWMPEGSQDSRLYGMTFILRHYIEEKWTELFDLVSFSEAPGDYQDVVVLRRRGAA